METCNIHSKRVDTGINSPRWRYFIAFSYSFHLNSQPLLLISDRFRLWSCTNIAVFRLALLQLCRLMAISTSPFKRHQKLQPRELDLISPVILLDQLRINSKFPACQDGVLLQYQVYESALLEAPRCQLRSHPPHHIRQQSMKVRQHCHRALGHNSSPTPQLALKAISNGCRRRFCQQHRPVLSRLSLRLVLQELWTRALDKARLSAQAGRSA